MSCCRSDADRNSRVTIDRLQERQIEHTGLERSQFRIADDAEVKLTTFDFGGALTRHDIQSELDGAGAAVYMHGLSVSRHTQHVDNHTSIRHRVGPTISREEFRSIAGDQARTVFNGKVIVDEGADGTDSSQSNHNILLSEDAEINTKPELEIYADDVKCAHGATVGQLDERAVFYLQSRGISADDARHMLTRAFAASVLSHIDNQAVREYVDARLDQRIGQLVEMSE